MGWCGHCKKISGFLLTLTRANIYLNFLAHFILPCADAFFLHFTFPSFTNSCCIICRSPSRGKTFFGIAVLHADAIVLLLLMLLLFFCCCFSFSFSFLRGGGEGGCLTSLLAEASFPWYSAGRKRPQRVISLE